MSAAPVLSVEEARATYGDEAVRIAARHACWRAGDLSFFASEVQLRARALVYEHASRRVVWETNRRFGKSRNCVLLGGEHSLAFPGIRIPYAAPTAEQVRAFVHPPMLELTSGAPDDLAPDLVHGEWVFPPLQWYDAAGNPVRTKLHGGVELARYSGKKADELLRMSRVVPEGCENHKYADALRGTGTVFAVIDEARDIPILRYVLLSVIGPMLWEARSRWHNDVSATMLVASTPADEPDHPFVEVADAAEAKGAYFHATVYDCDHLDERAIAEAIEEAGGEHTVQWQVEGLAKRARDPKRLAFPEFDRERDVREHPRPAHFVPCVIGDGGFVDHALYAFGYFDFREAIIVIEDELVFQRTRSDVTDAAIAAKERELWGDREVGRRRVDAPPQVRADMNREEWGDPAEWADDDREPPHWQPVTKPRSEKSMGSMQSGVNRARVLLKGARVAVHPRCRTLITHVDAARWNKARDAFERVTDEKKDPVHHYDGAAAFVYFIRDVDAATNPYPAAELRGVDQTFRAHRVAKTEDDRLRGLFRRSAR